MAVNIGAALQAATRQQQQLGLAINLGSYDAWAAKLAQVNQSLRELRETALRKDLLASGGWSDSMLQNLDLTKRKVIELGTALSSGAYAAFAAKMAAANRELKKLQADARFQDLTAQHGRFLGSLHYGAEVVGQWAGKVGKAFGSIQSVLSALKVPSLDQIAQDVARGAPSVFERWTSATQDLSGAFGQVMVPILQRAITVVRSFADWVFNMPSGLRQVTVALVGAGVAAGIAAGAIVAAVAVVTAAMTVLNVETGGVLIVIGAAVTAFAALAGVVGTVAVTSEGFGRAWNGFMKTIQPVTNLLSAVADALGEFGRGFWDVIQPVLDAARPAFEELMHAVNMLAAAFSLNSDGFRIAGALIGQVVAGPLSAMVEVINAITGALTFMIRKITEGVAAFYALGIAFRGGDFNAAYEAYLKNVAEREKTLPKFQGGTSYGAGGFTAHFEEATQARQRYQTLALQESVGRKDPQAEVAKNTKDTFDLLRDFFGKVGPEVGKRPAVPQLKP